MNYTTEFYSLTHNLFFVIGILLFLVGIGFMFIPDKLFKIANKLNYWVSTEGVFHKLNKPIYKERYVYRHHRVFGILIIIASITCLYMLTIHIGIENVTTKLLMLAQSELEKWLFVVLYYILIALIILTFIFGVLMYIRPSSLKSLEALGNHWVDTDGPLKIMDKKKDLPDRILLDNPRIIGFCVIMAAVYIIWNINPF